MEGDGKGLSEWVGEQDRSRRGFGCDTHGQPALRFLPRTEKTKFSGLQQFVTALHGDSIKAPHFTMYSISRKFSPLTASPAVVRSTSTGNAQATTTGSSRQQEVTTDLKHSHGDIIRY